MLDDMLNEAQERFLLTIPVDKIAVIRPWNPRACEVAAKLIDKIRSTSPGIKVIHTGASSLGIAGVNDIDLCILVPRKEFTLHLPRLAKVLGKPTKIGKENIRWEHIKIKGFEVDCHMTEPENKQLQGHLRLVEMLKANTKLLQEYAELKQNADGLPYREYQRRKYEFYNRVLNSVLG